MGTNKREIEIRITMELEGEWARNLTREELQEYLKARLNHALGFRGKVKELLGLRQKQLLE